MYLFTFFQYLQQFFPAEGFAASTGQDGGISYRFQIGVRRDAQLPEIGGQADFFDEGGQLFQEGFCQGFLVLAFGRDLPYIRC